MDIKAHITKIVDEITKNPKTKEEFKKEPVKVVEKIIGVDLPDDMVMKIVDGVKAKVTMDGVSKAADTLKGMFK